jgi:serine O-acetyltransferase
MNMISFYRVAHWLYQRRIPLLPRVMRWLIFLLYNSDIPPSCEIGRDSLFAHRGIGVVLNRNCRIGSRVQIGQNVTIGGSFGSGVPVIGDDVWIGPGVRILGSIRVGNNVILGANAVVVSDIPDNCIAVGVPAHVQRRISPGSLDTLHGTLRED